MTENNTAIYERRMKHRYRREIQLWASSGGKTWKIGHHHSACALILNGTYGEEQYRSFASYGKYDVPRSVRIWKWWLSGKWPPMRKWRRCATRGERIINAGDSLFIDRRENCCEPDTYTWRKKIKILRYHNADYDFPCTSGIYYSPSSNYTMRRIASHEMCHYFDGMHARIKPSADDAD